jgi:hypothetical protein
LSNWQTLIAGILALVGAGWTVRLIRAQIRQTADMETNRRIREELAARAVLPMALAALGQYARDCIKILVIFVPGSGEQPAVTDSLAAPRIPEGVIGPLQAVARFAEPPIRNQISVLLAKLQLQEGRLQSLVTRTIEAMPERMSVNEGEDSIIDAADLHACAGRLFAYARDTEGARKLCTAAELKNALGNAGVWPGMHDKVYARIDQRKAHEDDK